MARQEVNFVEAMKLSTREETTIGIYSQRFKQTSPNLKTVFEEANRAVGSTLNAKAEGDAISTTKPIGQCAGLWAYLRIHEWFTPTAKTSEEQS